MRKIMTDKTNDRHELIQRYVDQTIDDGELRRFQQMLKEDATLREELLLYVRIDVAIRDYVVFHNYMDENTREDRNVSEQQNPDHSPSLESSALRGLYQKCLSSLFPRKEI